MAYFTLHKSERLKSKKLIELLFNKGDSKFCYPIKLIYLQTDQLEVPLQMGVTVPKKHFKKAVDRNLIKIRMREAYRLQRNHLRDQRHLSSSHYMFMFIYVAKEVEDYKLIEIAVKKILFSIITDT